MELLDRFIENVITANEALKPHYKWQNNNTGINLAYNMTTKYETDIAKAELTAIRAERDEAVQACVNAAAYLVAVHNKIQPEMTDEQVVEMLDKAVVKTLRLP